MTSPPLPLPWELHPVPEIPLPRAGSFASVVVQFGAYRPEVLAAGRPAPAPAGVAAACWERTRPLPARHLDAPPDAGPGLLLDRLTGRPARGGTCIGSSPAEQART